MMKNRVLLVAGEVVNRTQGKLGGLVLADMGLI